MAKQFNVSIIGYGLSAKIFHIPFIELTKGLKLHSVVQRHPSAGNSAAEDHPSIRVFPSVEPMFQDPEVDLVVLSTPPNTHYDFARKALESGKHVLVEKPFVPTSKEAEELAALAREKKKLLCVYQNRRWDSDFLTVQKLLKEDKLGRIYEFETHFDRFRPNKKTTWQGTMTMAEGNGVIFDLGTHVLDQVYVLFGKPTTAFGKLVNQREGRFVQGDGTAEEEPDSVNAVLTYADRGLLVHVRLGVLSVEEQQPRFWVRGTKGSYHKNGLDTQEPQLRAGAKPTDAHFGVDGVAWNGRLEVLAQDGPVGEARELTCPNIEPRTYLRFYELLAGALATGREEDVPVPAGQAADVLRIIEAIRESAKSGKDVPVA